MHEARETQDGATTCALPPGTTLLVLAERFSKLTAGARTNAGRWILSLAVGVLVTLAARLSGEWWAIADPSLKANLWTARAVLLVSTTLGARGLIAVLPRMNGLRWTLLAFWLLYMGVVVALGWPGALMSDSVQVVNFSRQLTISTWFSWIYGLGNIALLDLVPHVWFLTAVQALGTAAVLAYAGDVVSRRGRGARWPVVVMTVLLAVSAPLVASTLLQTRDTAFGVLHVLLALVLVDVIAIRQRANLVALLAIGGLVGVLSALRGDGVALLAAPLLLLVLRPKPRSLMLGAATIAATIVVIRVLVPSQLVLNDDPFRYGLTLRLPAVSAILARAADTQERRDEVSARDKADFDAHVNQPIWSKTPEADLAALRGVLDLERIELLATPYEIPAYWGLAYRGDATPAEIARFNEVADRLIRDNLPTVLAAKLQTFAAASGLQPSGFFGVVGGPDETRFAWIPEAQRQGLVARAPWEDGTEWLGRQLTATTTYEGLKPSGSALFWNLVPWTLLLLVAIAVRGRWWPEAAFAAVLLVRVPLVALAAPAAQFKYYYSVYLGGVVVLGLILAGVAVWLAERRRQPVDSQSEAQRPGDGERDPADPSDTRLEPSPA